MNVDPVPLPDFSDREIVRHEFRRAIVLETPGPGVVTGELEDDYHHFRVAVRHDGEHVTAVEGEAVRFPWSTCRGSELAVQALVGTALSPRAAVVGKAADAHAQCTHLFDLTGLAVAHAARADGGSRRYDVSVGKRIEGRAPATLWRDGAHVLALELDGDQFSGPPPFMGVSLRGGFFRWADEHLDLEGAETAGILRRACDLCRNIDLHPNDFTVVPMTLPEGTRPVCFTITPGRFETARRPPEWFPGGVDFAGAQRRPLGGG
ncbi:MAG: hypothetical protein JWL73_784 [Actinomycetia bacterium]|nr:hypothetical protein [Actinomycetes bacterium]